jgi:hypothetical protein
MVYLAVHHQAHVAFRKLHTAISEYNRVNRSLGLLQLRFDTVQMERRLVTVSRYVAAVPRTMHVGEIFRALLLKPATRIEAVADAVPLSPLVRSAPAHAVASAAWQVTGESQRLLLAEHLPRGRDPRSVIHQQHPLLYSHSLGIATTV